MEDLIFRGIADIGVPAVVCLYLITRTSTAIDNNTKALQDLTRQIDKLLAKS